MAKSGGITVTLPSKLFDTVIWYRDSIKKTNTKKETISYGKPFCLARSIGRMEMLKNYPKGYYFKTPKHVQTSDINASNVNSNTSKTQKEKV